MLRRNQARWISALVIIALLGGGCVMFGEERDQTAFNYPPGPVEGATDYFTVAEDGQARCCLVIPVAAKAEERTAARMLQAYLNLATGAELAVCPENKIPAGLAQVHIGGTKSAGVVPLELPELQYGRVVLPNVNGYLIQTVSTNLLIIRGNTPRASILAVAGLLKRYLGVRRYWPGTPGGIGDVVPRRATVRLPQLEWRDWPYFVSRIMSGLDNRGPRNELDQDVKFADFWRMNYTIPSNENYYRLLDARNRTNEPDIFPLIDGKRYIPHYAPGKQDPNGWQPCVSNPKVVDIMAESLKKEFREHPDNIAMNLAVNDGAGDCTCAACRAMDAPGADPVVRRTGLCDRYIKFDNQVAARVAEEFPDKILAFIAYGAMINPPTTVKLHPILMPVLCDGANIFQAWDAWRSTGAANMGVYFYHDDLWFIMPKLDIRQSAKRIRYIVASGRARGFYQEFYGVYPLDGMVGYVEQELLWDPRLDVDDLLNEYYQCFYEKAGQSMRSFYELLEADYQAWLAAYGKPHPHGADISSLTDRKSIEQFKVLTASTATKAQACLEEALAASVDQPRVQARIALVKKLFDFAALGARMYWGARERLQDAPVESAADAEKMVADARAVVDSSLALAEYKFKIIEMPEIKAYADHGDRDTFYCNLQQGVVHAETLNIVSAALGRAGEYLQRALGAEQAVAWWQAQAAQETRPVLKNRMRVAAFDAGGRKLENLVNDPGYEERGARPVADTAADKQGHLKHAGANVWHSANTPMHCALTDETAHGGKYAFVFWQTVHAGVSESIQPPPQAGDILRMSVWVKHNAVNGKYIVQVDPRHESGKHLARATAEVPWQPDTWQKIELLFTVEPGTKILGFWVFADAQEPGAKIWVDDYFVGKYPGHDGE